MPQTKPSYTHGGTPVILTIVSGSCCDDIHLVQGIILHHRQSVGRNNTDKYVYHVISIGVLVVAFIGRLQWRFSIELKFDAK